MYSGEYTSMYIGNNEMKVMLMPSKICVNSSAKPSD